jgi:hypothetical protein
MSVSAELGNLCAKPVVRLILPEHDRSACRIPIADANITLSGTKSLSAESRIELVTTAAGNTGRRSCEDMRAATARAWSAAQHVARTAMQLRRRTA